MINLQRPLDMNLSDPNIRGFLENLQGNILKGHGRQYTAHFLIRFNHRFTKTARTWLSFFANDKVTSALDQNNQKERHQQGKEELFAMVLLSATGYRALRINDLEIPDEGKGIFKSGMKVSFPNIEDDLPTWGDPYQSDIHAMIMLAHGDKEALEGEVRSIAGQLTRFCELVHLEEGEKLIDNNGQVIENFGYADGISNPVFIEQDIEKELQDMGGDKWNSRASLDTVLYKEPNSDTYGSFVVFRKLEQNPVNFNSRVTELARELRTSIEEAGARIMGRYRNGQPLILKSTVTSGPIQNNFNFDDDTAGTSCPFSAHIRKTNPRGERGEKDVRIARRGMTYGARRVWLYGENPTPEIEVGLLFMSFQSDIDSFETLQKRADDKNFIQDNSGVDTIAGRRGNQFVTPRGGEYFFAPSIPTLKNLQDKSGVSLELSDAQKDRFKHAVRKLWAEKAVLGKIGTYWSKRDLIAAVREAGVQANDIDDFYAYLIPYLPQLYPAVRTNLMVGQSNQMVAELPLQQIQPFEDAFLNLLDPVKLDRFSQLWAEGKRDEALISVGLEGGERDAQLLYGYLAQYNIQLSLLVW
jgi:Dyp-type peroxidase family